jgi:FixJ family two-component response regulator
MANLSATRPTVLVVDGDASVLRAIGRLLRSAGWNVLTFDRADCLLAAEIPKSNACLVFDLDLPDMTGVDLYKMLAAAGHALPVIMMTAQSNQQTRRIFETLDAVAVLYKPFDELLLFDAIDRALALSASG